MSRLHGTIKPDLQQMKTIGMALLLVGSITPIVWVSTNNFLSVQDTQERISATIDLDRHVSQLQSQYRNANPKTLETEMEQAEQLLIQDFTHLAQWAQDLQHKGKQWNLQTQYQILKAQQTPAPVEGLTVIPMEIRVSPGETASAYRPYLQFLQTLEKSGPHIDIHEITVIGDGKKATHLTVGLSLWMKTQDSVEL